MEPLSPGLASPEFGWAAYSRGSPSLLSAMRTALPGAPRLFSPEALAHNLGDVLSSEDPDVSHFMQILGSPGSPSAFQPVGFVLPSPLVPLPPLELGALGTFFNPLATIPVAPMMVNMGVRTLVDTCTQTSPIPGKKAGPAGPAAPGGAKRSRGRPPAAGPAPGRPSGAEKKPKASSEVLGIFKAPQPSPPPPGPRTARRRPAKPTAQGPAKQATSAPAGGFAAPAAPKKRAQKDQPEAQAAPKKAKVGPGRPAARPAAAASESHGSAAPLPVRATSQVRPRPQGPPPPPARPTKIRLTGVGAAGTGAASSRGAKALTLARDAPAPASKPSGVKIRLVASGGVKKPAAGSGAIKPAASTGAKIRPAASAGAKKPPAPAGAKKPPAPAGAKKPATSGGGAEIKAPAPGGAKAKPAATPAAATAAAAPGPYTGVACEVCGEGEPAATLLLCGACDRGFHANCLRPAVGAVPAGPWLCCGCRRAARAVERAAAAQRTAPEEERPGMTKSEAARRSHLPLPPGKLRRPRRAMLQALVYLAAHHGEAPLLERQIRDAFGDNPDVSKAVRALLEQGAVERSGDGNKGNPFVYKLAEEALPGLAGWQAELAADAAVCDGEEKKEDEGAVSSGPGAQGGRTEGGAAVAHAGAAGAPVANGAAT